METSARNPSPISEEADDDDDSSSVYGRTIKRIMQRTRTTPELSLSIPARSGDQHLQPSARASLRHADQQLSIEMAHLGGRSSWHLNDFENRSLYSISELENVNHNNNNHRHSSLSLQSPSLSHQNHHHHQNHQQRHQYDASSFGGYDNEYSSTTDQQFEFAMPSADDLNKPPAFARRYFATYNNDNNLQGPAYEGEAAFADRLSGDFSESSEPDLNTKWSWKNLKREFKLSHSESLFHLYQAKLQHSFFVASLILNIIFNLGAVVSYSISKYHEMNIYLIVMRMASIVVFISFLTLIWFDKLWMQSKFSRTVASLAVLMAMIFGEASGAICALVNDQATPLASIRRTYYLIITCHVFLPFPTRIQACAATIVITSFEIIVTYISRRDNNCRADYLTLYSIADIIFYASSAMIGFQITFLLEIAIRRTFLNHKYCIQSTYKLNYEKEQQEQLLRSCFPQHLIEQIRNEIRDSIARISKRQSQPFKPFYNLYVEKYENVTILYADIVNSMNLTDKLNPAELVETLNELYGRFDELAEKYSCLRIKLLGDCYYCVSGLPEYDEDHAMNCLLMGLGMIKIIQSIRQSRNVDIDMRIGIHSGSVLSGLLGLRKWQFDIWSFDAMKASSMEHDGQPGFVHITQETLDLISKKHARHQDLIITETRKSNQTTYLISERVCARQTNESNSNSPAVRRIGQSEKLKAYIEKLRVSLAALVVVLLPFPLNHIN